MKSNVVKVGVERVPNRSLFKAMGYTDEEISCRPKFQQEDNLESQPSLYLLNMQSWVYQSAYTAWTPRPIQLVRLFCHLIVAQLAHDCY